MSALTQARMMRETTIKFMQFPLAAGQSVFTNGMACIDTATGTLKKGAASTTLIPIGDFAETVDNSAGGTSVPCNVSLDREIVARWYANDTGVPVTAAMLLEDCYILNDQTVTSDATGHSVAGRIWAVDSVKGVLVQKKVL